VKVAVVGSRTIRKIDLDAWLPNNTRAIITGGAAGVDTCAMAYARQKGLQLIIFYPDYKQHGRGAPLKRNDCIVKAADLVIAFWDGKSRGTSYTIGKAHQEGKPCRVVKLS